MTEKDKACREACSLAVIEHIGPAALSGGKMSILEAFEKGFQAAWNRRSQPECRKDVLLKAAHDLLMKQENSGYVLNLLSQAVYYDEADCDGYCLMEDIAAELEIGDYAPIAGND